MFDEAKFGLMAGIRLPEGVGMTDRGAEEPVDDVVEQHTEVLPDDQDDAEEAELHPAELPLEADEADAAEQARTVGRDDDDYR